MSLSNSRRRLLGLIVSVALLWLATGLLFAVTKNESVSRAEASSGSAAPRASTLTCRLGYAVVRNPISTYNNTLLLEMRGGLYLNYGASPSPAEPLGMEYVQMIRVHQAKNGAAYDSPYVVPYTYTVSPDWSALPGIVQSKPGALWLISNEPDRRDWNDGGTVGKQDETVPELYARAYYELHNLIKAADPTARVGAGGGLIEGTPLRIEYLNRMWNTYLSTYGTTMPMDVFSMHEFILPEDPNPLNAGAGYPAGLNPGDPGLPANRMYFLTAVGVPGSESYRVLDMNWFAEDIGRIRSWMAGKNLREVPLLISERGALPDWINPDAQVSAFMNSTFNYLLNQTDPSIGNPLDGNRLVQSSIWFSLDDDRRDSEGYLYWGGHLINSTAQTRDPLGVTWYNYVQTLPDSLPDLQPARVWQSSVPLAITDTVNATVIVDVINTGNIGTGGSFSVTLRDGSNNVVGTQTMPAVSGCALMRRRAVFTLPLAPGLYTFTAQVNSTGAIPESDTSNNSLSGTILVATQYTFLPFISR